MYHQNFLQKIEFFPVINIIYAGNSGLNILVNAKQVIIDGTFDLCEGKLILNTIMGYHEGVAIPCAYFLTSSKEKENYKIFFQTIKVKTGNRLNPDGVLVDFEEALGDAFIEVFPSCSLWRDFFHFQQAIVKNLKKMKLSDLIEDVSLETHNLWNSSTKEEFDKSTNKFLSKWDEVIPQFTAYYRNVWIKRFKPETWASYARPDYVPSGINY